MHIRPAAIADVPSILQLDRQSPTAGHWTSRHYLDAIAEGSVGRLVLVADQSPTAGISTLHGFLVARNLSPEWELENLVIAPSSRRNGLGTRFLDALLTAARDTNSQSVFLEVRESNSSARSLYEKAGFQVIGSRKSYYANPIEDALLYRRTL